MNNDRYHCYNHKQALLEHDGMERKQYFNKHFKVDFLQCSAFMGWSLLTITLKSVKSSTLVNLENDNTQTEKVIQQIKVCCSFMHKSKFFHNFLQTKQTLS